VRAGRTGDEVALVLSDQPLRERLARILRSVCRRVTLLDASQDLREQLGDSDPDFIVLDAAHADSDAEAVAEILGQPEPPEVVVVADEREPERDIQLFADGVSAVVPLDRGEAHVRRALGDVASQTRHGLGTGPVRGSPEPRLADFLSDSPRMREFVHLVSQVVDADTTLLLLGETGVGKEHLARAIHAESRRGVHPFVAVNCGALPESLLESELFGHERGAFTGAHDRRRGQFEAAGKGTILLDEIGDMPKSLQVKLLAVLQRREFRRVGGEKVVAMDARVVAATNRNLRDDVEEGRFREDLYYRLNVVPLTIPPLRERPEDLPQLIGSLLRHFGARMNRTELRSVHPRVLQALLRHAWPGNVRELINVIERGVLLASGDQLTLADLPDDLRGEPVEAHSEEVGSRLIADALTKQTLAEARQGLLQRFERAYLSRLLEETGGQVGKTAERAGISPRSLYDKMKRHDLRKEEFRE